LSRIFRSARTIPDLEATNGYGGQHRASQPTDEETVVNRLFLRKTYATAASALAMLGAGSTSSTITAVAASWKKHHAGRGDTAVTRPNIKLVKIKTALVAILFSFAFGAPAKADVVIQWASNFRNVTIKSGGLLTAVGNTRDAARFEIVRLEGSRIAFRASDGSYVRAGVGQQTLLSTGSPHIRGWETFVLERFSGDTYSLRSLQNGKFVTLDRAGNLAATASMRSFDDSVRLIAGREPPQSQRPTPNLTWTGNWTDVWVGGPDGRLYRAPNNAAARFTVHGDMTVSMTSGCNTIGSRLTVFRSSFARFSPALSTRIACGNAQQQFERRVASAMAAVRSFDVREGQVAFLNRRGQVMLQIGR
jgi:heat shock protein HslJ